MSSVATAKVIEDSVNTAGHRLTTFQLRYQRFVHAEFLTHRVFSRNASSSRAIPVAKMIEQVRADTAMPVHWGKNQPGMQAREQHEAQVNVGFTPDDWLPREEAWKVAAQQAAFMAERFMGAGYHKQVVNRILEPFQWISVVVSATEWGNFYDLRNHEDAQPEIQHLAMAMREAHTASTPTLRQFTHSLEPETANHWHLPYVTEDERWAHFRDPTTLAKISTARCARVSYLTHDGAVPDIEKDLELYDRLVGARPLHASPTEHPACVMPTEYIDEPCKNFVGWVQHREEVEARVAP